MIFSKIINKLNGETPFNLTNHNLIFLKKMRTIENHNLWLCLTIYNEHIAIYVLRIESFVCESQVSYANRKFRLRIVICVIRNKIYVLIKFSRNSGTRRFSVLVLVPG